MAILSNDFHNRGSKDAKHLGLRAVDLRLLFAGWCQHRPRGLMDKASDFESEDCGFESRRGHLYFS